MSYALKTVEEATYAMRQEADAAGNETAATLAKALGNALIGKLAQRLEMWEQCSADYMDPWWGEWIGTDRNDRMVPYRSRAGEVSRRMDVGLAPQAVPQIPAWIWAHGRLWLWERMFAAGMDEVMYADTDGLIVTAKGYHRLEAAGYIHDNAWGELRYQLGPEHCTVHGPKCVEIGPKIVMAGAPYEQRAHMQDTPGYWFRKPFYADPEPWTHGQWVEEFRDFRHKE
jgi:hypothetical protein